MIDKKKLIIAGAIFWFGALFGNTIHSDDVKVVKGDETVKTIIKTETETVTEEVLPPSCAEALTLVKNIHSGASRIYMSVPEQVQFISDARKAIAMNQDLSKPENDMLKLRNRLSGATQDLALDFDRFESLSNTCKEAQ